ncbi:BZ3500_MvSof-1268-A1-R1_Chr2-1g04295 [Microbotryum saponariae]|uniref:BZ3500_MvSof-1268-A1-R1_Chr2-1g04295 protein n=1 Tax=Microbotryum saponariae TaxID=289078 RepID=A0A2X0KYM5_9BASI|nr:BZ3500_MvSof-1268-A1-R1_Chr2-1g04295 [Microbotryum saponariae]SCZ91356.1 BZ3501_MvSof-1269-A2-R1_Chr2-1g03951 [Microbotryum saponariae]
MFCTVFPSLRIHHCHDYGSPQSLLSAGRLCPRPSGDSSLDLLSDMQTAARSIDADDVSGAGKPGSRSHLTRTKF